MNKGNPATRPDYKRIYEDILDKKYPGKRKECESILKKVSISGIDIIELNKKIFGNQDKETMKTNQKHRSYSRADILKILNYQKKNMLNNSQLAMHFNMSKNTVTKWKKTFLV